MPLPTPSFPKVSDIWSMPCFICESSGRYFVRSELMFVYGMSNVHTTAMIIVAIKNTNLFLTRTSESLIFFALYQNLQSFADAFLSKIKRENAFCTKITKVVAFGFGCISFLSLQMFYFSLLRKNKYEIIA